MIDVNDLFEKGKDIVKEQIKKKIITGIIVPAAPYILGAFLVIIAVCMFLGPILNGLNKIKEFGNKIETFWDRTGNLLAGRGFQVIDEKAVEAKEEAFNKKLSDYYKEYLGQGVALPAPLILSTVYYPLSIAFDEETVDCLNNLGDNDIETEKRCKENGIISGEDQYDYWKEKNKKLDELIKYSIAMYTTEYMCNAVSVPGSDGKMIAIYVQGDQVGETIKTYPISEKIKASENCTNTSNIKVYNYDFEEEGYNNYLKESYIPKSPEYMFPEGLTADEKNDKLNQIIDEIYELAELYYYLFDPLIDSGQMYGAIPYEILSQMVSPVDATFGNDGKANYRITSCFSPYRVLSNGKTAPHQGIDLTSRGLQNVMAVADGTIVNTKSTNNYNCYKTRCEGLDSRGNYVVIRHEINGILFYTLYYHLAQVDVRVGDSVIAGKVIGKMGNTGGSSGTHLHFQYNDSDNVPINPGNLFTNPYDISDGAGCSILATECASRNSAAATTPLYGKWGTELYPINVIVNGNHPIPLEQYILGVALNEMPSSYSVEALKAQMVTARTYIFGGGKYKRFTFEKNQVIVDMGVASEATQTFDLNKMCQLDINSQSRMIQALDATRGQILVRYNTQEMFSSEYASCAANDGNNTLGDGYVKKIPSENVMVKSYCTSTTCNQNGRNVCGHGRGMSQIGANVLATDHGYNYTSILSHYYNGQINYLTNIDLSIYKK